MAYDPQRERPSRLTDENRPSPVDSLLDETPPPPNDSPREGASGADPTPAGTVAAAGPTGSWSDRLLYSGGFSTMLRAAIVVAALAWLWSRMRRKRSL